MKKAMAVLVVSIALAPTANASQSTFPDQAQAPSESQAIVIVNPTPEQVLSADRQILPSSAEGMEEGQPLDEDGGEGPTFDVPVVFNEKVESHIHYFTDRIREKFTSWLARSERYLPMMKKTFREKGLPEDLTYLALIESGFSTKAVSRAKAVGQWQFIKGTGKRYGLRIDNWIDERRDPEKATEAAAQYLSDLYVMFNDWYLAAASYNAGEGKIARAIDKYDTNDFWQLSQPQRRYLKRETKDYVPKFIAAALIAKEPEKYGLDDIEYHPPLSYESVSITRMMDLREIAAVSGCDIEELRALNPELKTNFTPPNYPDYQLKVPVGKMAVVEANLDSIKTASYADALREARISSRKDSRRASYDRRAATSNRRVISYIVREGDTIWDIAMRYNVPANHLAKWNNLKGNQLKAGKRLKIYVDRGTGSDKKLS